MIAYSSSLYNTFELLYLQMNKTIKIAVVTPLRAATTSDVSVPGSKSYSLRALVVSGLCEEEFNISNLLASDDVFAMQDSISALKNKRVDIEVRESGLTARFMTALACISEGTQIISGRPSLQKRPIKDLVNSLHSLGAEIEYTEKEGFLPLKITSSELTGAKVTLKGSVSSQYLSALLLIAPKLKNGLEINIEDNQISKPYIDMTIDIMSHFGVQVENDDYRKYIVKPQRYVAKDYTVEADYSSASYFYAINHLTGSDMKVKGLNPDSHQGDKKFVDLLKKSELPEQINAEDFPDQAMTLAILAAFKNKKTVIKGIASLRIKETERIKAIENEFAKMGILTDSTEDSLTIYGGKPRHATIDTYGDHRLAMAFATAGCQIGNLQILNPQVVNKTFPEFWNELSKITDVKRSEKEFSNILLIGMRGSGKSTAGKTLAEKLNMKFIDMDDYLEQKHGMKVRDIVLKNGWEYFRDIESQACEDLSQKQNTVISSGGGIVLKKSNMELFESRSITIMLRTDPSVLSARIKNDKNRPELSNQPTLIGELDEVWKDRKNKYYEKAVFMIDTTNISPNQAADEIIEKLEIE